MDTFFEILSSWERTTGDDAVYQHLDTLLPKFNFVKVHAGSAKEHWASRYKADLSLPTRKNAEKTVVYRSDMRLREQGEWDSSEWILTRIAREMDLTSAYEVYKTLDVMYCLDMPKPESTLVTKAIKKRESRAMLLQILKEYFQWQLSHNDSRRASSVRSYLKRRGFDTEAIESIGFGYVPSWDQVEKYITQIKHFDKADLDAVCGVRNEEGRTSVGKFHILSIPYICGGVLKGFMFRRVDGNEAPKYLACQGLDRKSTFFNMPEKAEFIVVVEGEMDALTAVSSGIPDTVAIGGSDISGDRRKQVVDAFSRGVKRIYLCPDLDSIKTEGGREEPNYKKRYRAVMKSVHTIKDVDIDFDSIFVVELPEICDPDSYIRKHGRDAFLTLLKNALPYWEFVSREISSGR